MKTKLLAPLAGFMLLAGNLFAQVPQLLNYQGRVAVGTPAVNFTGSGLFRFALVDAAGTTSYWSNDGSSSAGSQPTAAVTLTVTKGLYAVLLGDANLPNMTAIPNSVFNHPDVRLRVWFDDGPHGPQRLIPDQRLAAVGYAMMADNVKDGAITAAQIAAGAVGSTQLATNSVQAGHIAAGAVGTVQMADFAITSDKLRPGYEAGTLADGTLDVAPGVFAFTRTFAGPFSVAPAVSLLTPGWALGAVSPASFTATLSYPPEIIQAFPVSAPPPGRCISLAVVGGALPAVSYSIPMNHTLKYVHAADPRGTVWNTPGPITVDNTPNVGQYSSLAVVAGNPAIAYYAANPGDLKYVSTFDYLGAFWNPPVTIDSADNVGQFVSLAEVAGNPAISYYDATNTSLKYIRAKDPMGMEWELPLTLDNAVSVGAHGSLAVINGNPAISYHDATNGDLKYIRATDAMGANWGPPLTVDTGDTASVGTFTALTVVDGKPAISYYDGTNGDLKYIRATDANGTAWSTPVTPDSTGSVGTYSSLQVVNGRPAISYFDGTQTALKYVHATDAAGMAWSTPLILDNTGTSMTGQHTSLAVVDGVPAVGYYQQAPGSYKFAVVPVGIAPELAWQASDGSIAPITAAAVANGAIGTTQLAANAVQASNISAGAVGSAQLAPNLTVSGALTAASFQGDGSGLTGIPATAVAQVPPGMVLIPAGAFTMGNTVAADTDITNAAPVTVTLSAYYIAVNEVTFSQWLSVSYWAESHGYTFFMNTGHGKGPNHPAQMVTWHDAVKWCNARSEMEGLTPCYYTDASQTTVYKSGIVDVENAWVKWNANGYRLPTEAEWEKAARGGLAGQRFPWGDTITQNLANYQGDTANTYDLGPNGYNAIGNVEPSPYTTPVGTFASNGYGLCDMAGNIDEWCWDWYGAPYEAISNPHGPATGTYRSMRGGGWGSLGRYSRTAFRGGYYPGASFSIVGFRPARSAVP